MTGRALPVVGSLPRAAVDVEVDHGEACITCGDVAVALTVIAVDGGDARCRADDGGEEVVAVDLIDPVVPGDRVLVHARVALERLDDTTSRTEG